MKKFDKQGREIPDSREVEVPLRFRKPYGERDEIRRMIAQELSRAAEQRGMESLEESDDFDVGDEDALPVSVHELSDMQEDNSFTMLLDKGKEKEDDAPTVNKDRDKGDDDGNGEDGEDGERVDRGKPARDGKEPRAEGKPNRSSGSGGSVSKEGK